MMFVEQAYCVIPATPESLAKFPVKDLRSYARDLEIKFGPKTNKKRIVQRLFDSGRATLCATLGD